MKYKVKNVKWKLSADSLRGRRHERMLMLCQDNYCCKRSDNYIVCTLLDGIGKTDNNAHAGKTMADYICHYLLDNAEIISSSSEEDIAFNLMINVQKEIFELSRIYEVETKELSSTLVSIIVNTKKNYYVSIHIGDGVIVGMDDDGIERYISRPENGEYSNQTSATTSQDFLDHVRIKKGKIDNLNSIILASDGVTKDDEGSVFIRNILESKKECVIEKKGEDDKSIIKISRITEE